jgi:hypothetical protein
MAEMHGDTIHIDGTDDSTGPVHRGVQAMWREQNAAFRARVLEQLRSTRQRDEQQPQTA